MHAPVYTLATSSTLFVLFLLLPGFSLLGPLRFCEQDKISQLETCSAVHKGQRSFHKQLGL